MRRPPSAQNATLRKLRRHAGAWLGAAILAPLASGVLLIWQAWTLSHVLGSAIEQRAPLHDLATPVAVILILLVARAGLSSLGERAGSQGAEQIKLFVRDVLFSHLLASSPRTPHKASSGVAANAIIDQVEALDGFFARYLPTMVQATLLPLAFGAVIIPLDWVAGLLFLVTAPMIPLFMALVGLGAQQASDRQARALSLLSGRFADRLRGLTTLKLFGCAEAETKNIVVASEVLRNRTLGVLRIAFLSSAVLEFFAALSVAGVALYVGLSFIDYFQLTGAPLTLQLGMFLLLMAPEVYNPLRQFASHYHDRAAAKAALTEITAQLGALPAKSAVLADAETKASVPPLQVTLEDLTLRTPDESGLILDKGDLQVKPGEHIALLGPSGVGKTSLIEAIAGFRRYAGTIEISGVPLAAWPEAKLRGAISYLPQKPRILAASVYDNIAIARPGATTEEVRRAAERAQVTSFSDALEHGIHTMLGEGGFGLSGGQAQRVALARVHLRASGLILLDEPTAHLDGELEAKVLSSLKQFAEGRTLIVATHSLEVARRMDRTFRIVGRKIVAVPTVGRTRSAA